MAARERALAEAIAEAVRDVDADLILVGLAASELPLAGTRIGLQVAHEAFADRRYEADGRLVPRSEPGSVIDDIDEAIAQAISIATRATVIAHSGETLHVQADTICVHGDRADAGEFARRLRHALVTAGIDVRALARPR